MWSVLWARARTSQWNWICYTSEFFWAKVKAKRKSKRRKKILLFLSDFRTFFLLHLFLAVDHSRTRLSLLNSCWNYSKGDDRWFCHLVSKRIVVQHKTFLVQLTSLPTSPPWFTHKSLKLPFVIWLKRRSRRSFIWLIRCLRSCFNIFGQAVASEQIFLHVHCCAARIFIVIHVIGRRVCWERVFFCLLSETISLLK